MISFTENGYLLGEKIREKLYQQKVCGETEKSSIFLTGKPFPCSLQEWTGNAFQYAQVIVFIGACGIAVRSIAPFLQDKYVDPAVIVMDEAGKFCISLLSGHVGGANDWTDIMAKAIGAVPVITTATDLRHCFAVDVFAKKKGLYPYPKVGCKEISAALVREENIYVKSDFQITGALPDQLLLGDKGSIGIHISLFPGQKDCFTHTLYLIPKIVSLGIGCKKNITEEQIEDAVFQSIKEMTGCESVGADIKPVFEVWMKAICQVASIDIKKEEMGIQNFAKRYQIPFLTFSKEALIQVEGTFTGSSFVESKVGVDNVCERAAVAASGNGRLMMKKRACNGVTVALAMADWSVDFA